MLNKRSILLATLTLYGVLACSTPVKADFEAFKASIWRDVQKRGVPRASFEKNMSGLTLDQKVLAQSRKQPEFFDPLGVYIEKRVSEARISKGRALRAQWSTVLSQIEDFYGVDRDMVLSVWGMETNFGSYTGDNEVIRALATLAYAGKRQDFFRKELVNALYIAHKEGFDRSEMLGSWAGAMGHTQFMPSSYLAYAADGDGDGRRDIWQSIPDALASTANYLKEHGWEDGKTWGYEVVLPKGKTDELLKQPKQSIASWSRQGVERANGQNFPRGEDEATLTMPAGTNGPAFLLLKNFDVIRTYNNSRSYAFSVGHLGDRIGGGNAFVYEWPEAERLTIKVVEDMQTKLKALGYYTGEIDGRPGLGMEAAIKAYQTDRGLIADGQPTRKLLEHLRKN
jgi:membrane-bound lytic murein transglycosylase B